MNADQGHAAPRRRRTVSADDLQAFLALSDLHARRLEEVAKKYEAVVIEPGGPEEFYMPRVWALGFEPKER